MTVANVIDKTNVITKLWFQGCRPDPTVFLHGFNIAAIRAFSTLVSPNWKTLTKKVTGHSWLCGMKAVLLEADEADALYSSTAGAVFTALEWVDAAAFYFWVAGVGIEFLIDWTSLVYQFSGCKDVNGFANQKQSGDSIVLAGQDFVRYTFWDYVAGREEWCSENGFVLPPGSHCSVSLRTKTVPWMGLPLGTCEYQWRRGDGQVVMAAKDEHGSTGAGNGGAMNFIDFHSQPGIDTLELWIRETGGGYCNLVQMDCYLENSVFNDYKPYRVRPSNC